MNHGVESLPSKIKTFLIKTSLGVIAGGICGAIVGALYFGIGAWLKESPEEQGWVFFGTLFGMSIGLYAGAFVGLVAGLVVAWNSVSRRKLW